MAEIASLPFDIIEPAMPPAPPPDYTWVIVLGAAALTVLLVLVLIHWRRTRQRRLGRKRLAQARQDFLAGLITEHQAAFAIADALRSGFGRRQIVAVSASDTRWPAFVERLDRLRYSTEAAKSSELGDLFAEAAIWLRGKAPC